jgi:hypothetical protein
VHATALRAAPNDEFQCLIEPYRKIEIRSAVEALIDTVHVQRGSVVRKGQRLVDLQADVEKAALASAKYRAVMEGQVKSSEARVDYATDKLRRRETLSQQNYVSSQDRDDAAAELRVAQADLLESRDNRQLSVLESRRLEELLRQRTLTSPFDGVVTEVEQHPGELAQTGEGARPILKMAQIHPLRVEVVLPVALYNQIPPMKLYYSPGACSLSPHIALDEAGLAYEAIAAPTKTHQLPDGTDYYTINPLGYVPLLELDDGTRLREGPAIVQYIADQAPPRTWRRPTARWRATSCSPG